MTAIPERKDIASRLARLERAVDTLQRRSTLGSASISGGDLTIRGGGSIIVRDGGNITGYGDGSLDWAGDAHFGGNLLIDGVTTVNGDAHFGGDLLIDGNTTLGGDLTWAPGVIPPEALSRRTEARTFGAYMSPETSNTFSMSTSVAVPDWAAHTSIISLASVYFIANARAIAHTTIDGNAGEDTSAYTDTQTTFPTVHRRDFTPSPGSTFDVVVSGGAAPASASPTWEVNLVIMAVFTN